MVSVVPVRKFSSKFQVPRSMLGAQPGRLGTWNLELGTLTMVYLSRIYTKSGDRGDTGLGDGQRVVKDHPRVEAYGQVDELNAVLGLVAAHCPDAPESALLRGI